MPVENCHSTEMTYLNLSGYRFVALDDLPSLQADMQLALKEAGVLGTVLLAEEGINVALSAPADAVARARHWFDQDSRFAGLWLKESWSEIPAFTKLKVRIRPEIISFDRGVTDALNGRDKAPALPPATLKAWLDEGRDVVLLDTRNNYEVHSGTFKNAVSVNISNFRDFPRAIAESVAAGELSKNVPVVTFCTGGIRCEKAAPFLAEAGINEVYQIEGGILNWFEQCGGAHWQGDCFVFDDRVEITPDLVVTGSQLCRRCHRAVPLDEQCVCQSGRYSAEETV